MGLEVGSWISDLNSANPLDADGEAQGAAHFRLVKSVLLATLQHADRATDLALLNNVAALSVLANATNALAAATALVAGTDGQVLRRSGTALAFGKVDTSLPAAVTHPELYSYNTADSAFNTTAYADVTNMQTLTLETGALYEVEAFLYVVNGGASGFAAKLLYSNAPAFDVSQSQSASVSGPNSSIAEFFTASGASCAPGTGVSGDQTMFWRGMVKANAVTGGTVKMQMKQLTAAGTSNAKANLCFFKFKKVV